MNKKELAKYREKKTKGMEGRNAPAVSQLLAKEEQAQEPKGKSQKSKRAECMHAR